MNSNNFADKTREKIANSSKQDQLYSRVADIINFAAHGMGREKPADDAVAANHDDVMVVVAFGDNAKKLDKACRDAGILDEITTQEELAEIIEQ